MKIIAKYNGRLKRKCYCARKGCRAVLVSAWYGLDEVHVIASAVGVDQLDFITPCFSDEKMWQLLQAWIKAYL